MKRILTALLVLTLSVLSVSAAFAAEPGSYPWRTYSVEVAEVKTGGFFAPADMKADEYCVTLVLTGPEDLLKDDGLMHELYPEAFLADPEGNTYAPGTWLTSDKGASFLYAVPKAFALEDLTIAFGGAAEQAEEGVIALGDQGRVKLTRVTEYSEDLGLHINGAPKGKWVCVILTVLDGAEMDASAAFDLAREAVALDDFPIDQLAGRGVKIDMAAAKAKLVGDIVVFFDVPADYDLSGAAVKLNGAVTAVPAAE